MAIVVVVVLGGFYLTARTMKSFLVREERFSHAGGKARRRNCAGVVVRDWWRSYSVQRYHCVGVPFGEWRCSRIPMDGRHWVPTKCSP